MSLRPLVLALPKGRILNEALPLLAEAGLAPDAGLAGGDSRALRFATARPDVEVIRVRSFDAATFVAFGGAQLGIVGNDVLEEAGHQGLYAPVDLGIGRCRLSLAAPAGAEPWPAHAGHVRVATKYPRLAARYFARQGLAAECVTLAGAMELAPALGLAPVIVDLVSTGRTLADNGLVEREVLMEVSSRLVVERAAWKTDPRVRELVGLFAGVRRSS